MTTKSRDGAAAAFSWFNNVNHPSHAQVSMGRGPGQSRNTLSQTWWCDKRTTVLVSAMLKPKPYASSYCCGDTTQKSPSKVGASASYGHDGHDGHENHSDRGGHSANYTMSDGRLCSRYLASRSTYTSRLRCHIAATMSC